VLTYKLGGKAVLPPPPDEPAPVVKMKLPDGVPAEQLEFGRMLYNGFCGTCHGLGAVSGGVIPDLRYSGPEIHAIWNSIVLDGAFKSKGMAGFKDWIGPQEAELIRLYVLKRAGEGDVPPEATAKSG
jgi:quinohemoprotein ethanol dehydrogenase